LGGWSIGVDGVEHWEGRALVVELWEGWSIGWVESIGWGGACNVHAYIAYK